MNPATATPTNWLPGLIVFGGGLVLALLYLLATRQKGKGSAPAAASAPASSTASPTDGVLDDLTLRYQSLIEQLKELSADKHHLSAEQFQAERSRLELEAAATLRARDERRQGLEKKAAPRAKQAGATAAPQGFFGRHPQLLGAAWGAGVVLFFAVLWAVLSQNERPRGENESATGKIPPGAQATAAPQSPQEDQEMKTMVDQVNQHPENVEAAGMVAHELLRRQQFDQANAITERALGMDPFNVENRIHRALLMAVKGDSRGSMAQLQHLADTYPESYEALLFLGSIAGNNGDLRRALDAFERFATEAPAEEQPPQLAEGILQLRRQLGVSGK